MGRHEGSSSKQDKHGLCFTGASIRHGLDRFSNKEAAAVNKVTISVRDRKNKGAEMESYGMGRKVTSGGNTGESHSEEMIFKPGSER